MFFEERDMVHKFNKGLKEYLALFGSLPANNRAQLGGSQAGPLQPRAEPPLYL